ncbi:hypothetical protein HNQ69_001118 [Bartonella callosciuri]|uniref:Uncharacterized protein n=1 Tax=Bartonella callosciuri TaxID=686223 RepID=A0A840NVL6_9HYPH|nr:hypothetical protein [Bartonella callosciuri]MBB5073985.1 hypothetical protein [Bartonella callosciuri]
MIQQKEYGGEKFLTLAFMCVLTNLNTPYEQAANNQIIHSNSICTLNIPQRVFEGKASRNTLSLLKIINKGGKRIKKTFHKHIKKEMYTETMKTDILYFSHQKSYKSAVRWLS